MRKIEDEKVQGGVLYALLGDCYLRVKRFKEAIDQYRKAMEILPELSRFIKPVVEDLSTKLDPLMDGVYEEMYSYFSSGKEFIFNIIEYIGQEQCQRLYLISDSPPFALYTSGISYIQKDSDKSKKTVKQNRKYRRIPVLLLQTSENL